MKQVHRYAPALAALAAILALGLLAGCSNDGATTPDADVATNAESTTGPYENAGTLRLTLIDAPVAFDDIILVVRGISAHRASEDTLDGWYGMAFEPAEYHLLDLTNGVSALLADADLPAGTYDQIRLLLGPGNRVVIDGQEFDLKVPSGLKTGLKIKHVFEIVEGETLSLTLDFDAERSVRRDGKGRYRLQPVIRVQETDAAGGIEGIAHPADALAEVWVTTATDTVRTFADATTGYFQLAALPAGMYVLTLEPTGEGPFQPVALTGVEVVAGQITDVGTVELLVPIK